MNTDSGAELGRSARRGAATSGTGAVNSRRSARLVAEDDADPLIIKDRRTIRTGG